MSAVSPRSLAAVSTPIPGRASKVGAHGEIADRRGELERQPSDQPVEVGESGDDLVELLVAVQRSLRRVPRRVEFVQMPAQTVDLRGPFADHRRLRALGVAITGRVFGLPARSVRECYLSAARRGAGGGACSSLGAMTSLVRLLAAHVT